MPNRWLRPIAQFFATALTMWLSFVLSGGPEHILPIWPLSAVQLAIALGDWRGTRERFFQLIAAFSGVLLATGILGIPVWIGGTFALAQALEVALAATILIPHVARFDDLKRRINVLLLGFVSLLVPATAVGLAALPISVLVHRSPLQAWGIVFPSDTLGLLVILPALLFLTSGEFRSFEKLRPHFAKGFPALLFLIAATTYVFVQNTSPYLFLIFPPVVVVLLVLGLEGAAFASFAVSVIAIWATALGHGPILLARGATPDARIRVLQMLLAAVVAVALPVGALFDERRKSERVAKEGQAIYQTIIEHASDMIILSSLDGGTRFISPAIEQVTGWTPQEYLALGQFGGIHPEDVELTRGALGSIVDGKTQRTFRYRARCKDGTVRWMEAVVRGYSSSEADKIVGYVATVHDISAQLDAEQTWSAEKTVLARRNEELSTLVTKDELTGVSNRRGFNLALEYELARIKRFPKSISILMIDVDFFKKFNDKLGHLAGDECLHRLAQAMAGRVRQVVDIVARIGGEEFAVILPGADEHGARKVAEDILNAIQNLKIAHPGSPIGFVTVSIGSATWPMHYTGEPAQLLQQADIALYQSKGGGRNRVTVSEPPPRVS